MTFLAGFLLGIIIGAIIIIDLACIVVSGKENKNEDRPKQDKRNS